MLLVGPLVAPPTGANISLLLLVSCQSAMLLVGPLVAPPTGANISFLIFY